MRRQERYDKVMAWFESTMPAAESELHFASTFQLLVAVNANTGESGLLLVIA